MSGVCAQYSIQGLKLSYNDNLLIIGASNIFGFLTASIVWFIKFWWLRWKKEGKEGSYSVLSYAPLLALCSASSFARKIQQFSRFSWVYSKLLHVAMGVDRLGQLFLCKTESRPGAWEVSRVINWYTLVYWKYGKGDWSALC